MHHENALHVKAAVLALKRFTVGGLCEHTGLSESDVTAVLRPLIEQRVVLESSDAMNLTSEEARVQDLAGEIYRASRAKNPRSADGLTSSRFLLSELKSLNLALDVCDDAGRAGWLQRPHLEKVERQLQNLYNHVQTESYRLGLTFRELEQQGHPLFGVWDGWQRCGTQLRDIVERWRSKPPPVVVTPVSFSHGIPHSLGDTALPATTLVALHDGFMALDELSADLDGMEAEARDVWNTLKRDFDHELCAVQRIRLDDVIETVVGEGLAREWVGLSKHRVAREPILRDIQADVVLRQRAEVIRGFDPRLDQHLYDAFGHDKLVRLFVPLVLFRDPTGKIVDQPPQGCWRLDLEGIEPKGELVFSLDAGTDLRPDVFGTVETGFEFSDSRPTIVERDAYEIIQLVTKCAPRLYKRSVDYAFEQAVGWLRGIANAEEAFLRLEGTARVAPTSYCYSRRGQEGRMVRFRSAEQNGTFGLLPPEEVEHSTIKPSAGAAMPDSTRGAGEQETGRNNVALALHMGHYRKAVALLKYGDETPDEQAVTAASILANRCSQVLGTAFERARLRELDQQMRALNKVVMSFFDMKKYSHVTELGRAIVWCTHNLLAADVVTLYEYDEKAQRFIGDRMLAGRLVDVSADNTITDDDVRIRLVNDKRVAVFAERVEEESLLNGSLKKGPAASFTGRERIRSTAAMVLTAGTERVGVMFINFRVRRTFTEQERDLIVQLAQASARALRDYRSTVPPTGGLIEPLVMSYGAVEALGEPAARRVAGSKSSRRPPTSRPRR